MESVLLRISSKFCAFRSCQISLLLRRHEAPSHGGRNCGRTVTKRDFVTYNRSGQPLAYRQGRKPPIGVTMIGAISLMRRQDDIDPARFRRHWLDIRGRLVCRTPELRSYAQSHVIAGTPQLSG